MASLLNLESVLLGTVFFDSQYILRKLDFIFIGFVPLNVLALRVSSTFGMVVVRIMLWNIRIGYKNNLQNGLRLLEGILVLIPFREPI